MSGERILVIDDSQELVKHLTERVLPLLEYQTLTAFDGQSGLDLIYDQKPDLILLDLNLPDMNGLDILHKLAHDSISIPIILMTGYGSEKSAVQAFRLGVKDYLVKPFTTDELDETLERAFIEKRLRNENQQLNEQMSRLTAAMNQQINEMSSLFGIGKSIASVLDREKVIERLLPAAAQLTNAHESSLWLPNSKARDTSYTLYRYIAQNKTIKPRTDVIELDPTLQEVFKNPQKVRHAAFSGNGIKVETGLLASAIMYIPIQLNNELIGVMGTAQLSTPQSFSYQHELLLSILAGYAAIAFENARLFEKTDIALSSRVEDLHAFVDVTKEVTSTLDLHEVVHRAMSKVHDFWAVEASSVWLLDDDNETLSVMDSLGSATDALINITVPVAGSIVGSVVQSGDILCTNDVANHPLHYNVVDQTTGFSTRSMLCAPLEHGGKIIGAMQLINKLDGNFTDADVDRIKALSPIIATAVSNAVLFTAAESRKQWLEATIEHNGNPIIILDHHHQVMLLNQEARRNLNLTGEALGYVVTSVIQYEPLLDFLLQPLTNNIPKRQEITLADNTVWLSTLAPIPDYGRILILQDITYLKELDRDKNTFLTTASHDLRAPLNAIIGFSFALEQMGPLNEQQKKFVSRIISSSQRMMDLVNALLDLAKVNSNMEFVRQTCHIGSLTNVAVVDLQAQALKKQITLELKLPDYIPIVVGDPNQIRQAVNNLVDNSIKYSPPKSVIKVEVTSNDRSVMIHVRDNGRGISQDDLPFIFDKFYRVQQTDTDGGVGLGLTLVRSIAEAHQGRVEAVSREGAGSRFTLYLPIASPAMIAAAETPPQQQDTSY
ncbi:MAG TPA: ATP-binding protein [Anaerolineae bacterium]|nr:ATP-binding protein [Anaerolineae bacterium]